MKRLQAIKWTSYRWNMYICILYRLKNAFCLGGRWRRLIHFLLKVASRFEFWRPRQLISIDRITTLIRHGGTTVLHDWRNDYTNHNRFTLNSFEEQKNDFAIIADSAKFNRLSVVQIVLSILNQVVIISNKRSNNWGVTMYLNGPEKWFKHFKMLSNNDKLK